MSGDAFLDQGPPRRHHDLAAAIAIVVGTTATAAHPPTSLRDATALVFAVVGAAAAPDKIEVGEATDG